MSSALLVLAAFLASAVEAVEALTIVLAVGVTHGWRSTAAGIGCALLALAGAVAALGPALRLVPIDGLRLVVGGLLLVFGLQWLRKSILRAAGVKTLHDEQAIYAAQVAQAQAVRSGGAVGLDWYAFTVAFKGVLLEGLEVVFIVLTFGATQGDMPLAVLGAVFAIALIAGTGAVAARPLARVPENTMKFAVGVMLTTFGTFWAGEGAGVVWPGSDAAILGILLFVAACALLLVAALRQPHPLEASS